MSKKFYSTVHASTKMDGLATEIYLDKNIKDSVDNLSLYDDDQAIVYEVTLTPIKRVMRGYVDLPLKVKSKKKLAKRKFKSRS